MLNLNKAEMWQAVIACDGAYDGRFYYGVTSTGIFCRPSCKSRPPRRENTVYFATVHAAFQDGYRPCKRCRPDVAEHAPVQEAVRAACELIESEYANPAILTELPRRIGLSRFHLARLIKHHSGATPREYLHAVRVRRAQHLLITSSLSATEIGYEVGFNSPSGFFAAFRARTGLPPRTWRLQAKSDAACSDSGGRYDKERETAYGPGC